ncbi:PH domain-containing protein [Niallia sp. 01092]|uniref:PH domain-containing protein n=1 Tax=unclassified Niallia TaxID=2837522 RepID=UPI003FD19B18
MEGRTKRLHPLKMLLDVFRLIKNNVVFAIILFVLNFGTEKLYMKVLQIVFLIAIVWSLISIVIKWTKYRYTIIERSIHLSSGLFTKSYRTISLNKIQNMQRHTSVLHKIFGITSLTFETGESGDQSSISFSAISKKEAEWLEHSINEKHTLLKEEQTGDNHNNISKVSHFKATRKEVIKASFTSLSFLALIPLLVSIYKNVDDFFNLDGMTAEIWKTTLHHWWLFGLIFIVLTIAAIAFGIVSTFWKYGNYEILSDQGEIYIKKGVVEEISFSIQKEKVQAIEIIQSPVKRLFKLAEVKLISTGDTGEEELKTNSLYPFLPINKAYEMIHQLLPEYKVEQSMEKLSKKAFLARMLEPSFIWIFGTAAVFYFKPSLWYVSILLFCIIYALRVFDYRNSRYLIHNEFVQMKSGSLKTSLFITKRSKVMEIEVKRTKWQKKFGLATIKMINRSKPLVHTKMMDVPLEKADVFYIWYTKRILEIEMK